jgi:hypothetical protein
MLCGRRTAVAAAFAVVAVAVVGAGCGGGSSSALRLDPVSAAATKTQNAGAARIRFAIGLSRPQLGGKASRIHGRGAIDGTSTELSFRLGHLPLPSAELGRLTNTSIKEITVEQNGDYVIYMQLPFLASRLPGGKQWVELDLSKLGKSAGIDLGKLMSGSQFEPSDMLSVLEAQGAKVHKLGTATVDGTATTHYRVTIDPAEALQSEGLTSPLFRGIASEMKTLSAGVWVGNDGLVRRVRFAYRVPKAATRLAMTMDLYDYGAHVSIAAPPSGQVFDATQFAQQGLAAAMH